jgi:hypothetical protein
MSSALTNSAIRRYVRTLLGEPTITVELTNDQLDEVIAQTLGIYGTLKPVEKLGTFSILEGVQKYTFTEQQVGRGIIELFQPDPLRSPITLGSYDVFRHHATMPNLDPGDFYAERAWWEEVRRSAGSDDDWEFVHDPSTGGGSLYVSPPPTVSMTGAFIYVVDATVTEVPAADDDLIKDYTLAICMQIVGRIRRKFQNVQGAESSLDMDGEQLVQEGLQKQQDLDEYLNNRGSIVPPIRG